jgi:hypothetical protein
MFEDKAAVDATIRAVVTETTPQSDGPPPRPASTPDPVQMLRG